MSHMTHVINLLDTGYCYKYSGTAGQCMLHSKLRVHRCIFVLLWSIQDSASGMQIENGELRSVSEMISTMSRPLLFDKGLKVWTSTEHLTS